MSIKKQIVLIPYWIQESLIRNKLSLGEALNLPTLKNIVSQNDLFSFYQFQNYFETLTGVRYPSVLHSVWSKSIPSDNYELKKYLNNMVSIYATDQTYSNDVEGRIFSGHSIDSYKEPFAVFDLSLEVSGIVVYPGFYSKTNNKQQKEIFIEAMLKILYVYNTHDEVSKTLLFRQYLELLSQK